ncbi:hypothetical protein WJX73_002407 [Symbiochloris irregularis]|uniref:Uncharacterized protein n=1 Tax=Symbiochloris irregularis TaxID=706552 RepID=A0AAW1P021_9CHLO
MATKRKADAPPEAVETGRNTVSVNVLGAGQEVGRSCVIIKYMGKTVMLDCGVHPGRQGINSLPFLDSVDLDEVDIALITHFHLDHCAAVPYLLTRTNFKGRVFMTHPTKAVYGMLLRDFAKLTRAASDEPLYTERDVDASLDRIEVVDFHQTLTINGIQVCAYRAGHVLGAAMFMVEIAGMRALYTGDYSRLADRHLSAADLPEVKPHIVIVESTYGVSRHLAREEREDRFRGRVQQVLARGGRLLLPCVALGRAQELMLILEELWERSPALRGVPIYQASGQAKRALSIFQTYTEMMNDDIRRAFRNPFEFKHITHLNGPKELDDTGSCVVLATPSMLQAGLSRELFDAWCEDSRNGIIIADFAVQGTLARDILGEPATVVTRAGRKVPLRMTVDAISFSAHADFDQTSQFIDALDPPHVVLVHGEATEMGRLRKALEQRAAVKGATRAVHMPLLTKPLLIHHRALHLAKVVGRLADKALVPGRGVRGVLVRQGLQDSLMSAEDLPVFTRLRPGRIVQQQTLALTCPFSQVRLALEVVFEGAGGSSSPDLGCVTGSLDGNTLRVADAVLLVHTPSPAPGVPARLALEWEAGNLADTVADAVVAVIMQASSEPEAAALAEAARMAALKAKDPEAAERAEADMIAALLSCQFGPCRADHERDVITLEVDGKVALIHAAKGQVECDDQTLAARLGRALTRIRAAMGPCQTTDYDDAGG